MPLKISSKTTASMSQIVRNRLKKASRRRIRIRESMIGTNRGLARSCITNTILIHRFAEHYRYFGSHTWKSNGDQFDTSSIVRRQSPDATIPKGRSYVGPSLDMLAPVVRVTHDYDALVLNNQNVNLAKGWQLGSWSVDPVEAQPDFDWDPSGSRGSKREVNDVPEESGFSSYLTPPRRGKQKEVVDNLLVVDGSAGSTHNFFFCTFVANQTQQGYMFSSARRQIGLPRPKSDPNLNKGTPQTSKTLNYRQDEPGVHGGEYSVRPNIDESMTFLRKLFTHQQAGAAFPTLLSPPDNPQSKYSCRPISQNFCMDLLTSTGAPAVFSDK